MKGGARARSGPAPDPNALRRERGGGEWTKLPPSRTGPTPPWPLSKPTKRELELWEREWRRPQAFMWEAHGQELEVAFFVRTLRQAESPSATAAMRSEARRMMDALGLTQAGMRANRWVIATQQQATTSPFRSTGPSVKERLKVVRGGGSA